MNETIDLSTRTITARVAEGRLVSVRVRDHELLADCGRQEPDFYRGAFVLAPWCGARPGARMHGLVYDNDWRTDARTETVAEISVAIEPDASWPHPAVVRQRFAVTEDRVSVTVLLETRTEPFAANLGLHPWFVAQTQLEFEAAARLAPNDDGSRTSTTDLGPSPHDDLFVDLAAPPLIFFPGGPAVELHSAAPVWVWYEHESGDYCMEPWTGTDGPLPAEPNVWPNRPLRLDLDIVVTG